MHELSVCLSLMQQIDSIVRDRNAARVTKITLDVGPLSGVEPELLRNAYPLAAAGTSAEGAELVMQTGDVVVHCSQCGSESTVAPNKLLCASCGDFRTRLVSGDELTLLRVELEKEEGSAQAS
ncbi:MAG: hydrogenase maturation nickel metallochaperone HypA [Woeseiaceae bacterium]|jgi:hydrogenase nickel incorporation protein HypA/HybF